MWAVLAEAHFFGGKLDAALEAAERAIERYEAKGNVISATQIRMVMQAVTG